MVAGDVGVLQWVAKGTSIYGDGVCLAGKLPLGDKAVDCVRRS